MTDPIDPLLTAWCNHPLDPRLNQMEPRVWARIESQRSQAQPGAWRWRAGLAAAMLGFGVFAGSAATAKGGADLSPFAVHSAYAPSTLLEGGR